MSDYISPKLAELLANFEAAAKEVDAEVTRLKNEAVAAHGEANRLIHRYITQLERLADADLLARLTPRLATPVEMATYDPSKTATPRPPRPDLAQRLPRRPERPQPDKPHETPVV